MGSQSPSSPLSRPPPRAARALRCARIDRLDCTIRPTSADGDVHGYPGGQVVTDYPFGDTVTVKLDLKAATAVEVRIPGWAAAKATVNGKPAACSPAAELATATGAVPKGCMHSVQAKAGTSSILVEFAPCVSTLPAPLASAQWIVPEADPCPTAVFVDLTRLGVSQRSTLYGLCGAAHAGRVL